MKWNEREKILTPHLATELREKLYMLDDGVNGEQSKEKIHRIESNIKKSNRHRLQHRRRILQLFYGGCSYLCAKFNAQMYMCTSKIMRCHQF